MSLPAVRSALESALASITPALATAYENVPFTPVTGVPYQAVYLMTAAPANIEIGPGYSEVGFLQVNLFYPLDAGPAAAMARAELIRAKFPFAASFVSGGVTVNIIATPEVAPGRADGDRYMVPVKARFSARIGS